MYLRVWVKISNDFWSVDFASKAIWHTVALTKASRHYQDRCISRDIQTIKLDREVLENWDSSIPF